MSLTLLQAETRARALTRHDSDTRFSATQWRVWANEEYRNLRTWLQDEIPELYLLTSTNQTIAEGGSLTLSAVSATLERIRLVEWEVTSGSADFRPLEAADSLTLNSSKAGRWSFSVENGVVKFGPDGDFSGTVRLRYYNTPADLTADGDLFAIPAPLEQALILKTCGWIALRDGDGLAGKREWDDMAAASIKAVMPALKQQHGVHPNRTGLHVVMGY